MTYKAVKDEDTWKVELANELIDIWNVEAPTPIGFSLLEVKHILDYVCTY